MIEELCKLKDHQLVWKYFDWVMKKDEIKGVQLFTKRAVDELNSERMRIDTILESLVKYKVALTLYLEHLIFTKNNKVLNYMFSLFCIFILIIFLFLERKV